MPTLTSSENQSMISYLSPHPDHFTIGNLDNGLGLLILIRYQVSNTKGAFGSQI